MLLGILAALSFLSAGAVCGVTDAFLSLQWLWMFPVSWLGSFLVYGVLFFLFAWIAFSLVRQDVPQEKDSPFYRRLVYLLAGAILSILRMRMHTRGFEKIPQNGRFFLVCNHLGDLDPVVLLHYFRKYQLAFISKRENSTMFFVGNAMHKILCQLVNRENDREAIKTILKCVELIQKDMVSIAVFPEGYTSVDGLLHPFRHGVFKIAQKTQVPIVICTLQNTNRVFSNIKRLKATDVHLHIVDVLYPESYKGLTTVQLGTLVHDKMAADLGDDLVLS